MLVPRRDLEFHLYEVLRTADLAARPRFKGHDREVFDGTLETARRMAEELFLPHAALTDAEEPRIEDGSVRIAPQAREALTALGEAGFIAAPFDENCGGLQLPFTVSQACSALFAGAHVGFHSYAMLTAGAANLLLSFGTEDQKERYARPMLEGRFHGTMCLSETGAGSSLADIRTLATPRPDGRFRLAGAKMWISGGEHELAENIIHMVLARTPGAPPGVRGISLFVVPRRRLRDDGSPDEPNGVHLAGLNHKMGWRGTVNTVLSFGDQEECVAELLGEQDRGLAQMFQMMNEARIGVGVCAVALGYAGYRYSLGYAQERLQGRPLSSKDPASPPVPIIQHADVRRMLLAQKAWVEGGLGLVLYCARLVDDIATAEDDDQRRRDALLLDLLTPIAKSWPAEFCLEANKLAIQVLGGYGYTRDYPVERLYRDNRLNHIHEGAYGIQGLDLLGRKVAMHDGAALRELGARVQASIARARGEPSLAWMAQALGDALDEAVATTRVLLTAAARGPLDVALANATLYLEAVGTLVVAWRWLEQALAALSGLSTSSGEGAAFYRGKLAAARHFFRHELPRTGPHWRLLQSLDDTSVSIAVEEF